MDKIAEPNEPMHAPATAGGLSRRAILTNAAVAVGVAATSVSPAGLPPALAETPQASGFGAPLVELYVPPSILTPEQKGAMIKGVTDVLVRAMTLPPEQARKLFVEIIETAEGGFGVGGQVFVPRHKVPAAPAN